VDRIAIGSGARGPVTREIQSRFLDIAQGRADDAHGWLTPVNRA
jgi:branched-chain amino acid aminotransferase